MVSAPVVPVHVEPVSACVRACVVRAEYASGYYGLVATSSTLNHEVSAVALQDVKREILCCLVVFVVLLPLASYNIHTHRCF